MHVIGEYAFEDCTALTEIALPDGLEELGDCAFGSCEMIQSMYFPSSLRVADVSAVQDTAWYNAKQEGELVYLGGVLANCIGDLPETLNVRPGTHTVKLENVYTDTLKTITLPDGLETLILQGTYTKLTSLTVPESVTYIDGRGLLRAALPEAAARSSAGPGIISPLQAAGERHDPQREPVSGRVFCL